VQKKRLQSNTWKIMEERYLIPHAAPESGFLGALHSLQAAKPTQGLQVFIPPAQRALKSSNTAANKRRSEPDEGQTY
jgi:hypothetical protein